FLQAPELRADGGRGQAQLLARARDAPRAHDLPEVEEVMVVQPFHGPCVYEALTKRQERLFYLFSPTGAGYKGGDRRAMKIEIRTRAFCSTSALSARPARRTAGEGHGRT